MRKPLRLILEFLGPAVIACGLVMAFDCVNNWHWPEWNVAAGLLVYSYGFAVLPSLIYAGIMEGAFRRGMQGHSWATVGLSTLLGALAGTSISFVISIISRGSSVSDFAVITAVFVVIGVAVGLILGLLIKALSPAAEAARPGHRLMRWDRPFDERV